MYALKIVKGGIKNGKIRAKTAWLYARRASFTIPAYLRDL